MKQLKFLLIIMIIGFFLLLNLVFIVVKSKKNQDQVVINLENKVDSLQRINDSFNVVLFPLEVEHTRYEIALEKLHEINPSAVDQFYQIVQQETE